MGTYATVADVRADPRVPAIAAGGPQDPALEGFIKTAELAVDRLVGPRAVITLGTAIGYKYDPTKLPTVGKNALRDAVVLIAVEVYLNPNALDRPRAKSVSGPDFTLTELAGVAPAMSRALEAAAVKLDSVGMRVLTARFIGRQYA